MRIYQNTGINTPENANLPVGTIGLPYKIISAIRIPEGYAGKYDVLQINAREEGKKLGSGFSYGLIGEKVFNPFLEEMNEAQPTKGLINKLFKKSSEERLVGKSILVFIAPWDNFIKGISPRH